MSSPIFTPRAGGADCPSELELDRWQLAELAPTRKQTLDVHIPGCPHCQTRLAERSNLYAQIPERQRKKMIDHIMKAADAKAAPLVPPWWKRWFQARPLAPAFAAAFALVLGVITIRVIPWPESEPEIIRSKGGLNLMVYREHEGAVQLARSGEEMRPGDRLRFGIDVPAPGFAMIVGIEASGTPYVCYPTSGASRAAPVTAGLTEALPGAIALDESSGREALHLIYCSTPFELDEVIPVDAGRLAERGCQSTSFELSKQMP